MRCLLTILFAAVVFFSLDAGATIINVPDDYPTIQEGIDHGEDGDTVLVQPDTYYENVNFHEHSVVLASLFLMTGDTAYVSTTIIDGDSAGSVITIESSEDRRAQVVGFTIQNGFAENGGGIRCSGTSPAIRNNNIIDNFVLGEYAGGGGVGCYNSNVVISDNRISGNWAESWDGIATGGAIESYGTSAEITGNTIKENGVTNVGGMNRGGGICCYYSNLIISNNTITGNLSFRFGWGDGGGGIYSLQSDLTIQNNVIAENTGDTGGGAYFVSSASNLMNNTFWGNWGYCCGGGIYCEHSDLTVSNSIFWQDSTSYVGPEIYAEAGTLSVTYCDVQGGWPGEGNIDVDPLFRDPQTGDLHLMAEYCGDPFKSPCIDAGDPDVSDSLLDCFHGLGGERSDMGAHGGRNSGWPTGVEDDGNDLSVPRQFVLHQNYPNPFNATTRINYQLPVSCQVKLEVFNVLGQKLATLVDSKQQTGYRSVMWDASEVSSGIYFYKLTAGDFTETRRMMLIK